MHALIEHYKPKIIELCKRHLVKELYVFGGIVRDDFTSESDVDFLVEYDEITEPGERVANEDESKESMKHFLQREVDFVPYKRIKNKYLRHFINQDKKLLYAEA